MAKLTRFSTPAGVEDLNPAAWSRTVEGFFAAYVGKGFPQFYDPTKTDTPAGTPEPMISWVAFPSTLQKTEPSKPKHWLIADQQRDRQDEYCEWTVTRSKGKVAKVTFTTELPEFWGHLFRSDPDQVVELYRQLVNPGVKLADLRAGNGSYKPRNKWNASQPGRLAHMIQGANKLRAAIDLVARATVPRVKNGKLVVHQQELMTCTGLGAPLRNSDPQIASAVNEAARSSAEVTLADPIGLYLGRPETAGMRTPDGTDAAKFWTVERGDARHTLRARFEVPPQLGYLVGDVEIGGRPIEFGGQVAERVKVWIGARIKKGSHKEAPAPCQA